MIKTLNKQLTHCESDLQTHMDEVSRLEDSLADSEKNRTSDPTTIHETRNFDSLFSVRKARMHATELARERDSLNGQMASLRNDLEEAKREVTLVRRSVVEEKQSLENRLGEERRAKALSSTVECRSSKNANPNSFVCDPSHRLVIPPRHPHGHTHHSCISLSLLSFPSSHSFV